MSKKAIRLAKKERVELESRINQLEAMLKTIVYFLQLEGELIEENPFTFEWVDSRWGTAVESPPEPQLYSPDFLKDKLSTVIIKTINRALKNKRVVTPEDNKH